MELEFCLFEWIDIHEYSGWVADLEPPPHFFSVGFLRHEDNNWYVFTDTASNGNAVWYPKGCILNMWRISVDTDEVECDGMG